MVVVGGGDSAIEEAIFLTRYAKSVTLVHRRESFRAGAILQRRAKDNPKIDFILDSVVTDVLGEDKVQAIKIKNVKSGTVSTLETDGVFIFIGHTPNTEMFLGQLEMEENGIIVTDAMMHTSVPGVFAAGEVMDRVYRQVVTSAGMGAAAAIEATRFLEREEVH